MIRWATAIYFYDHCRDDMLFLQKCFRLYCYQLVQVYSILYRIVGNFWWRKLRQISQFESNLKFGRPPPTYGIDLAFCKMLTFTDPRNFFSLESSAIWYMEIFPGEFFVTCYWLHRRFCDLYENSFHQNTKVYSKAWWNFYPAKIMTYCTVLQNKSRLKFKLNAIGKHGNWTNDDLVIFNQFT